MCKKLMIAVLAVVVVVAGVSGTRLGSRLVSSWKQKFARWEKKQITPEMELAHLRQKVEGLKSEEERLNNEIAEANLELQRREKELVAKKEPFLAADERLKALVPAVEKAKADSKLQVSYKGSESYSVKQAEEQIKVDWAFVRSVKPVIKSQEEYVAELSASINHKREKRNELEKTRHEMGKQLLVLQKKLAEVREKQRLEGTVNGTRHAAVSEEINRLTQQIDNLSTGTTGRAKGPIEAAEEQKKSKDASDRLLHETYGGTPVKN